MAETTYVTGGGTTKRKERRVRLVVRRTRLTDPIGLQRWPDWRHHAFVTNVELPTIDVDRFHRQHATVELAISDLKAGAGLVHCPSGRSFANAAWLACAVLAHHLLRWTARLGHLHPAHQLTVTSTLRSQVLSVPGRLVNRAGRIVLRRWPWAGQFMTALSLLRAAPPRHLTGTSRPAQPQTCSSALTTEDCKTAWSTTPRYGSTLIAPSFSATARRSVARNGGHGCRSVDRG